MISGLTARSLSPMSGLTFGGTVETSVDLHAGRKRLRCENAVLKQERGIPTSMSGKGNCHDNTMVERRVFSRINGVHTLHKIQTSSSPGDAPSDVLVREGLTWSGSGGDDLDLMRPMESMPI